MRILLVLVLTVLAFAALGAASGHRYQLVAGDQAQQVWRLDRASGEVCLLISDDLGPKGIKRYACSGDGDEAWYRPEGE